VSKKVIQNLDNLEEVTDKVIVVEKVKEVPLETPTEVSKEIVKETEKTTEEIGNQFNNVVDLINIDTILFFKDGILIFLVSITILFLLKNYISKKILSKLENTTNTINEVKTLTMNFFYLSNFLLVYSVLYYLEFPLDVFLFVKWILFTGYFYFGIVLLNTINKLIFRNLYKSPKYQIQKVEAHFFRKIVSFFIYLFGFLFVLSSIGFNVSILLGGLGFVGFAISFAAKESIANFFGGIMILFNKSFDHGDWIYVSDLEEGTVVETHFLTTTIRTFDNSLITIPNSKLSVSSIRNWSKRKVGRRIKFNVGLVYETKPEDIKKIIKEIKEYLINSPKISKETKTKKGVVQDKDLEGVKETLLVNLTNLGESSIDLTIYCFSTTVNWSEWLETREEVIYKVMEIIKANNSDFAFNTLKIEK